MEDKEQVEKTVKRGSRTGTRRKHYTYEERLRAVKLRLEEGFNVELVCKGDGKVSTSSLGAWLAQYRKEGRDGAAAGVVAPAGATTPGSCKGEDCGDEEGESLLWGEEDCRRPAPVVFPRGEPGDREKDAPRGGPHERAGEGPPQLG